MSSEFRTPEHLRERSPAVVDPALFQTAKVAESPKTVSIRGWRKLLALLITLLYFVGLAAFAAMTSTSEQVLTDLGLYGLLSLGVYTGGNAGVAFAAAKPGK